MFTTKDFPYYLHEENDRNQQHADLFTRLLKLAFGPDAHEIVLVGHHFVCEAQISPDAAENLKTLNEIPSADTVLFDHVIMGKVFGSNYVSILVEMAKVPRHEREGIVERELEKLGDRPVTPEISLEAKANMIADDDGMKQPRSGWADQETAQDWELEGGID